MSWDDLRVLLAVADGRTLSGAASMLNTTHTTVGRKLRACEERLGVRLFDRTPDGLDPTPAGAELVDLARRTAVEVQAAEVRIMGRDTELRGAIRVSTLDLLFSIGYQAFASFVERYPSIEMTITAPLEPVSLIRREADVVLRLTNRPPVGLVGRRIGQLAFAAYASPALVEKVGRDAPYEAYPWISLDERLGARWMAAWFAANAPRARIVARVDENSMVLRQIVQRGMAAYFLPVLEGDALGLRRIGPVLAEHAAGVWLLTLPDLRRTSRVRAFIEHMSDALPPCLAPVR